MAEHDVEAIWHDFWMPIMDEALHREGAPLDNVSLPRAVFDQMRRELFDYHNLLEIAKREMMGG